MAPEQMHLLRPDYLWLLLLALPISLLLWRAQRARGRWTSVIDPQLLPHLLENRGKGASRGPRWLLLVALIMAVVAMTGPSFRKIDVPVFQKADALVIVLDLSASMRASDIQPSRARRARQKIRDLLGSRDEGVTGLVVYAGDAHVVAPLTDDRRTIENLLPALSPDIMPIPGSNAEAAIRAAASLLSAAGVANGQILLITDGMPKFDPLSVAPDLVAAGAEIGILAVGTAAGAPIPLPEGGFLRNDAGDIVVPGLNVTEIQSAAAALGGRFAAVSLDNADIESLDQPMLRADRGDLQLDRRTDTWLDQGNWLALLLALGMLPLFRRGAVGLVLLISLSLPEPSHAQGLDALWRTPDQRGAQKLDSGDPEGAADLFENPDWRGTAQYQSEAWLEAADSFSRTDTADSHYNRGNALAKAGELERALDAYDRSLDLAPNQADAIRNRDLVNQLLQQQENQQSKEGDDGEQESGEQQEPQDQDGSTAGSQGTDSQQQSSNDADAASPQDSDQSDAESAEQSEGGSDSQSEGDASGSDQSGGQSAAEGTTRGSDGMGDPSEALNAQTQAQMAKFDEALEKQQALEQWLRRVPDDPGGLLRRKFRYESIQRLRQGEEPDEDVRW